MTIKDRCIKFIDELGVKATKLADNIGIGRSTLHFWLHGKIEISDKLQDKIDNYLKKYNF